MPVRIGFIGTGGITGTHFNALAKIADARLTAFCDVVADRAEAAARRFDGRAYTDARRMLEQEDLDAVYICLPPFAHADLEILAARKGCALFVEKPVANNMKVAEKIAAVVEETGVITAVGYHFRHLEASDRAHKLVHAKGAPQPAMAYGRWLNGFPPMPWWRRMEQSGGQMVEQTTHIIDLMRYLVGDVTRVHCVAALREMQKDFPDCDIPDVTALTLEFASGAIGYAACTSAIGMVWDTGVDIMVRDAKYEVLYNKLTVRHSNGETNTFESMGEDAYLAEDSAFVKAVKSGKPRGIKSDYADGLKTLKVTLAANQSARTGKPVRL